MQGYDDCNKSRTVNEYKCKSQGKGMKIYKVQDGQG